MKCLPGKTHTFDPTSGHCVNGCGVRDDGRTIARSGDIIHDGPRYTPEELAAIRRQIDPSGDED